MAYDSPDWTRVVNVDATLNGALPQNTQYLDYIESNIMVCNQQIATGANHTIVLYSVPAGKHGFITHIGVFNDTSANMQSILAIDDADYTDRRYVYLVSTRPTAADTSTIFTGKVYVEAGDAVIIFIRGATVGDYIYSTVTGYLLNIP